jgi:flagellar biosynthesis protein FlhA
MRMSLAIASPAAQPRYEAALVLGVMGVLAILFVPIPAGLLDLLLVLNISIAMLILLVTIYTDSPLSFSTFPSILLIATLFRLALNISTTRLILEDAAAGNVIGAVGSYVIGGNYLVGLVVFSILVIVQYVVVTNGAQRVAEVAARFTLDSMPGKQMSIDADINMGLIDDQEARRRRGLIEKEASFYGAMDGASKFVKGDAIAGVLIILINIIGGLAIGVVNKGMSWGEALSTYTLLTVGDGIVTQIPSLVIAVGTGIIITRAASDTRLGQQIATQLLGHRRSMGMIALLLAAVFVLPGMPKLPVLFVLAGAVAIWWLLGKRATESADEADPAAAASSNDQGQAATATDEDLYSLAQQDALALRLGRSLSASVRGETLEIAPRLKELRKQIAQELGLVMPTVVLRYDACDEDNTYSLWVQGARAAGGQLRTDSLLAINPGGARVPLQGEATTEPAYGLPAIWVDPAKRAEARSLGYTLVDPEMVLSTHLSEVLRQRAADLLTRAETERLIQRVKAKQPTLVEELSTLGLSASDVQRVLAQLLREQVSIAQIDLILEVIVDAARVSKQTDDLVERVREKLGPAICQKLVDASGELRVLTLAPDVERTLLAGVRSTEARSAPLADFTLIDRLIRSAGRELERHSKRQSPPALLCATPLRRLVRSMMQRTFPYVHVLGLNEVPTTTQVRSLGSIGEAERAIGVKE